MNKATVKNIAIECFFAGKENLEVDNFEDYFEQLWRVKQ